MTNVAEMSTDGCLRLALTVILQACEASDVDFLRSNRCIRLLDYIPSNMLQNALDTNLTLIGGKELSRKLVNRVLKGKYKEKYVVKNIEKLRRVWMITHPCGFQEEVTNIKEFALDMGLKPSALTNVANESCRASHKGFKVVKLV